MSLNRTANGGRLTHVIGGISCPRVKFFYEVAIVLHLQCQRLCSRGMVRRAVTRRGPKDRQRSLKVV